MKLAILADIHGNWPALEAILARLEQIQPDYVVVDGDLINGTPFSGQVIDCVRKLNWVVVRGNHEFYLLDLGTPRAAPGSENSVRWGTLYWLQKQITAEQKAYLAMLPDERVFYLPGTQPLRISHGLPGRNRVGIYANQPDNKIADELAAVPEETFVTAHTHIQIDRHVIWRGEQDGALRANPHGDMPHLAPIERHWHVVNPGSVGLPLNRQPNAQFAVMESLSPSAVRGGWQVEHHQVFYDRCLVLDAFATSGMLGADGIFSTLFYWEVVTAEPEILLFYRWAYERGLDPEQYELGELFHRYGVESGRAGYVRQRDPLRRSV